MSMHRRERHYYAFCPSCSCDSCKAFIFDEIESDNDYCALEFGMFTYEYELTLEQELELQEKYEEQLVNITNIPTSHPKARRHHAMRVKDKTPRNRPPAQMRKYKDYKRANSLSNAFIAGMQHQQSISRS